jgi:hypothetical protein
MKKERGRFVAALQQQLMAYVHLQMLGPGCKSRFMVSTAGAIHINPIERSSKSGTSIIPDLCPADAELSS